MRTTRTVAAELVEEAVTLEVHLEAKAVTVATAEVVEVVEEIIREAEAEAVKVKVTRAEEEVTIVDKEVMETILEEEIVVVIEVEVMLITTKGFKLSGIRAIIRSYSTP